MSTPKSENTGSRLGYYDQVMEMLDKSLLEHGLMSEEAIQRMKDEREKNKHKPKDNTIDITFVKKKNKL